MNRINVLIILCVFSIISNGQVVDIIHDENVEEYRKIQSSYTPMIKKGLLEIPFSLIYYAPKNDNEEYYALSCKITDFSRMELPAGSKMYLKLDNEEVIELETYQNIETFDNDYYLLNGISFYYIYPLYLLSKNQMDKLLSHRVVKIRTQITWGKGYFDYPDEDRGIKSKHLVFSENLLKMKISIDNRLNNIGSQSDLLNGF